MLFGLGLYLGEGSKSGSHFQFVNSNPEIIKAILNWLEIFGITINDVYCSIIINQIHRYRTNEVKNRWMKITKIPSKQFNKTTLIKANNKKIYANHKEHLGTLILRVYKSSDLQYKVLGLIHGLLYNLSL